MFVGVSVVLVIVVVVDHFVLFLCCVSHHSIPSISFLLLSFFSLHSLISSPTHTYVTINLSLSVSLLPTTPPKQPLFFFGHMCVAATIQQPPVSIPVLPLCTDNDCVIEGRDLVP